MYVNTAILMLPLRRSAQFKMFFYEKVLGLFTTNERLTSKSN